jgi:hypothetical protein
LWSLVTAIRGSGKRRGKKSKQAPSSFPPSILNFHFHPNPKFDYKTSTSSSSPNSLFTKHINSSTHLLNSHLSSSINFHLPTSTLNHQDEVLIRPRRRRVRCLNCCPKHQLSPIMRCKFSLILAHHCSIYSAWRSFAEQSGLIQ